MKLRPLTLLLVVTVTTAASFQLPILDVYTAADRDLTVLDFIEQSYQPVLITGALRRDVASKLKPWTFPALGTSLEAAITFCVARTIDQDIGTPVTGTIKRKKRGRLSKGNEESQISLRRFGEEGDLWAVARTNITKEIG